MFTRTLTFICIFSISIFLLNSINPTENAPETIEIKPVPTVEIIKEINPKITNIKPNKTLTYEEVNEWIKKWHEEAPEITEIGLVGTHGNKEINYIRIGHKQGPKVLITAAIHGNEKLCCMTAMGLFGKMLDNYMDDERITKLLKERDIYFIPILSPEGYINNKRHTSNLDPNRNWNNPNLEEKQSIPCVQAVKDFHLKHNFKAVMSFHNFAKIYFYPWGHTRKQNEFNEKYINLLKEMTSKNQYRIAQLYGQSSPPYYGYEIDWFHKHGAIAVINEVGKRFNVINEELQHEIEINYEPTIIFIEKSPLLR